MLLLVIQIIKIQALKRKATQIIIKLIIQFNKEIHKGKISINLQKDQFKIHLYHLYLYMLIKYFLMTNKKIIL